MFSKKQIINFCRLVTQLLIHHTILLLSNVQEEIGGSKKDKDHNVLPLPPIFSFYNLNVHLKRVV